MTAQAENILPNVSYFKCYKGIVLYVSTDTDALLNLHLNDEKHRGRGVKGAVVQGDDGGAMSCKQVAHLADTENTVRLLYHLLYTLNDHFIRYTC